MTYLLAPPPGTASTLPHHTSPPNPYHTSFQLDAEGCWEEASDVTEGEPSVLASLPLSAAAMSVCVRVCVRACVRVCV